MQPAIQIVVLTSLAVSVQEAASTVVAAVAAEWAQGIVVAVEMLVAEFVVAVASAVVVWVLVLDSANIEPGEHPGVDRTVSELEGEAVFAGVEIEVSAGVVVHDDTFRVMELAEGVPGSSSCVEEEPTFVVAANSGQSNSSSLYHRGLKEPAMVRIVMGVGKDIAVMKHGAASVVNPRVPMVSAGV